MGPSGNACRGLFGRQRGCNIACMSEALAIGLDTDRIANRRMKWRQQHLSGVPAGETRKQAEVAKSITPPWL